MAVFPLALGEDEARRLFDLSVSVKYADVFGHLRPKKVPDLSDLRVAVEVRNEITHHFPRPGRGPKDVPSWYELLEGRGLFIRYQSPPRADVDFNFTQKLSSYALAYWVFEVLDKCATELVSDTARAGPETARNFRLYRQFCPPAGLEEWDKMVQGMERQPITDPKGNE
jgi:hypothetical protein